MSRSTVVFAAIILQVVGGILSTNNSAGEVNPCQDFLSYAYKVRNPTQKLYRHISNREENKKVKDFFENYYLKAKELSDGEKKFYEFRKYCSQPTLEDKKSFLQQFNPAAGGWPALNINWKSDKFDLPATLAELQSSFFPVVFKMSLTNEPYSSINLIEVRPMIWDQLYDDEYKRVIRQKLSNITDNADEVIRDSLIVESLYVAEKNSSYQHRLTDYKGLKQEIPEINWDRHFEATYGRKAPDSYPVKIRQIVLMKRLIPKILEVEPKVIANYLLYRLVDLLPNFDDDMTIALFRNIIYQMTVKEHYTSENKEDVKGMLVSLLKTLAKAVNVFGGEDEHNIEKEIKEVILDKVLADKDSYYDNLYRPVTVSEDGCYSSAVKLVKILFKLESEIHFERHSDPLFLMRFELMHTIAHGLPNFLNKSSAIKFEVLTWEFLDNYFSLRFNPDSSKSMRQCLENQCSEIFTDYEIKDFLQAQVFVKAYFDWTKDKADLLQLEETKYNESSKKVLLERLIARNGDPTSTKGKDKIRVTYANLKEFSDTYNCSIGSPFNAQSKCEIV